MAANKIMELELVVVGGGGGRNNGIGLATNRWEEVTQYEGSC